MKKAVRYLLPLIAAIAISFPVAAGATEITQLTPDQITADESFHFVACKASLYAFALAKPSNNASVILGHFWC